MDKWGESGGKDTAKNEVLVGQSGRPIGSGLPCCRFELSYLHGYDHGD
jgi:hypothetical protein